MQLAALARVLPCPMARELAAPSLLAVLEHLAPHLRAIMWQVHWVLVLIVKVGHGAVPQAAADIMAAVPASMAAAAVPAILVV